MTETDVTLPVQALRAVAAGNAPADDGIEIGRLVGALWTRRWIVILSSLLGAVIAFAVVSQVTPRYVARASVMLDPRNMQVLNATDVVSDAALNNPFIDTEAAVLRSTMLIEQVLAAIPAEGLDRIDPNNRPAGLRTRISRLLGGSPVTAPATEEEAAERRTRRLVTAIRQSMRVWREGQSYLINVSVETTDARLSALIANAVVQEYLDDLGAQRSETVRAANDFLATRVADMRAQVEAAEAAVVDFRIGQLAETGLSLETIEQQLVDLGTQLVLARSDLAMAEARYRQIDNIIGSEGFAAAAELLSSPLVLSLREALSGLQSQEADLATTLGRDHPDRLRLRASTERLDEELAGEVAKIVASLRNEVEVAQIRVDTIQASLTETESRSAGMARASLEVNQLEREADALRGAYQELLGRLSETRSIEALQRVDARIVERATAPGAPSAPRVTLFTALGLSLGLSFGLAVAFLLAISGRGFTAAGQVEKATGMPVLVGLPQGRWQGRADMIRSLARQPYQPFAERLRQLRTTLLLGAPRGGPKVVLVTSALPGEGKTTVAVGLAYAEGLARRSCVLLDFDLRRSTLAHELDYQPPEGDLSDLLAGHCGFEGAIDGKAELGFDLITMREPRPDLIDELRPEAVERLIRGLAKRYSMVIIDSSPVLAVADTLLLARSVDEALLLVKAGSTPRSSVAVAQRLLEEAGITSVGVGLTMIDPRAGDESYGGTYASA